MTSSYPNSSSSGINVPLSPDSSLPKVSQEDIKVKIQLIIDEIDRVKKHDYDVIEKLSHDNHVFSAVSLILKLYLIPAGLLLGFILTGYFLSVDFSKVPFFKHILGSGFIITLCILFYELKKLPNTIKSLEAKFSEREREHSDMKADIADIKRELSQIKIGCQEKHTTKKRSLK
ncbi:MAG: hypothetical protein V8T87_03240 [Victivallales bacterium]